MTPLEVIARADAIYPNSIPADDKAIIVYTAEYLVLSHVLHYESRETISMELDTQLTVQAPWDGLYIHFLLTCIHHALGDTDRFNVEVKLFQTAFENWRNHYNATHQAKSAAVTYF